jgi:hypothetical protein
MRTSDLLHRVQGPLAGITFVALALSGCGRTATPIAPADPRVPESALRAETGGAGGLAQGGPSANLFYPLDLGNHWSYEHFLTLYFDPDDGPPEPAFGISDQRERELVCVESFSGRSYIVEQQSFTGSPLWWVRYRQDGTGLYEADVNIAMPPDCAAETRMRRLDAESAPAAVDEAAWAAVAAHVTDPREQAALRRIQERATAIRRALGYGPAPAPITARPGDGVQPGELTRLEYPLHPGATWVIRADPRFESTVEGADALDLAVGRVPGWRIRVDNEFLGPGDRVHFWYGRSGFLKLVAHFEDVVTDPNGNRIGLMIAEDREELVDLSLRKGRFAAN